MSLKYDIFVVKLKSEQIRKHLASFPTVFDDMTKIMQKRARWMNDDMKRGVELLSTPVGRKRTEEEIEILTNKLLNKDRPDFVEKYEQLEKDQPFGIVWKQFDENYCYGIIINPFHSAWSSQSHHTFRIILRDFLFKITNKILFQNFHGGVGAGNPYIEYIDDTMSDTQFARSQYNIEEASYAEGFSIIPDFPAVAIHNDLDNPDNEWYTVWDHEFMMKPADDNPLDIIKKDGQIICRNDIIKDEEISHDIPA